MHFIAIDLGTTNIKVCCYDNKLNVLATESVNVKYNREGDDIVEFDAEEYYQMVARQIDICCRNAALTKPYPITQIILTGQAESLVCLGKDGKPIRQAISWLDNRSRKECEILKKEFPPEVCYPITGQPEIIPTWPITKIFWLKNNEPEVFSNVWKYMLIKDYIIYRLSDKLAGEYSIYNFSHYFDLQNKCFWKEELDYVGIREDQLNNLVEPGTIAGNVSSEAQELIGLDDKTLVNVGTLDHFCGMIGTGNITDGMISESAGTVLSIATSVSNPDFNDPRRLPLHYGSFKDKYVYLPVCESGGISMEWFKNNFMQDESYDELNKNLENVEISPSLLFMPYITGSNAPENNMNAKGMFFGITAAQNRHDFALAVMEGVAHLLKKNIDAICASTGKPKMIISSGGGAKSAIWCQLKADVTGCEIGIPENEEACCLGAAIMGAVSSGAFASYEEAIANCVKIKKIYKPRYNELLEKKHQKFLELYNSVEHLF